MFSIVMPAYNCEKLISRSIQSVLQQTHKDFELIIVDDGSSDNTVKEARAAIAADVRARIVEASHAGVSAARNRGIEEARGDKVLFIDADDTWESDLLEVCSEKNGVGLVVFGICMDFYSSDGDFLDSEKSDFVNVKTEYSVRDQSMFAELNMSSPCNKVYLLSVIKEHGIRFSESCVYLEDLKFNIDYLQSVETISVIPRDLYRYRIVRGVKQIFKRDFKEFLLNAKELYTSAKKYLTFAGIGFCESQVLCAMCRDAFYLEFESHSRDRSMKEQKRLFSEINTSYQYTDLLKASEGKFFSLIRFLRGLGLKRLQMRLIKRRYN